MTKREQRMILGELLQNLRRDLKNGLDDIPSEWDGIELRAWFAERAARYADRLMLTGERLAAYNNTLATRRNL